METIYGIYSYGEDRWWSNSLGWVCKNDADLFNEEEKQHLNLPITGRWVEYVPDDEKEDEEEQLRRDEKNGLYPDKADIAN